MDELFSVEQVANKLKIHLMTVYKLISSGQLSVVRVPGVGLRVEGKELEEFLLGQNTRRARAKRKRGTSGKPRK